MGRTYVFENVSNFGFYAQGFEFDYEGASTGLTQHANFNNTCVAGYATTEKVQSSAK